jgi:cell division septum initiation protein DivIVA
VTVIEFKNKDVQAEYDGLQEDALDLSDQLEAIEQQIKAIEATEERE